MTTAIPAGATIPVLLGIPDDARVKVEARGSGQPPRLVVPGTAVFTNYFPEAVQRRLPLLHCTADGRLSDGVRRLPGAVINLSADPDVAGRALEAMAGATERDASLCFNHPRAVLGSGRDEVARKLADVPGLMVPATVRVCLGEPDDLASVVEAAGIGWPAIVRVAGAHSGGTTVRVDRAQDAPAALARIPWGGKALYVTQYVPYADADGLHRKLRIVVVGQEAFLRHEITGAGWQLHAEDHDPRFNDAERERIEHFAMKTLPILRDRLRLVSETMRLDFFGMDCSLRPDGSLLMFECNAAMNVLREKRMMSSWAGVANNRPEHLQTWQDSVRRIQGALMRLVFDPSQWRHAAGHPGRGMAS